jgi:ribosomal protein S18 acetylase RimI-like enzyme
VNLQIRPVCDDDVEKPGPIVLVGLGPGFRLIRTDPGVYHLPVGLVGLEGRAEEGYRNGLAGDRIAVVFVAYELNAKDRTGEVLLLAVHPEYYNRGIGTELNKYALARMVMAKMETADGPAHAPARRPYEKVRYRALPMVLCCLDF